MFLTPLEGPDMTRRDTTPLSIDDMDRHTLAAKLLESPSVAGAHGHAAVHLLTHMANGEILENQGFLRYLTLDRGQIFIDWAAVSQAGRSALADRNPLGSYNPRHPDAGYAMVLAAALATRQITDSGIETLNLAFNAAARA